MEISPKVLREVEFRDKMKGYHPDDVDEFLEEVAVGLEVLQDRLRQAVDRAQRAEQAASESGSSDETLRRTLVLAQRTADLTVREAQEEAAKILAEAEQKAQKVVGEAEERARRAHESTLSDARSELARLHEARRKAQEEVVAISSWVADHRVHLVSRLQDALDRVKSADLLSPPPVAKPAEPPSPTPETKVMAPNAGPKVDTPAPVEAHAAHAADETVVWNPGQRVEDRPTGIWEPPHGEGVGQNGSEDFRTQLERAMHQTGQFPEFRLDDHNDPADPDEAALDEFFEDTGDHTPHTGGRLRRRK